MENEDQNLFLRVLNNVLTILDHIVLIVVAFGIIGIACALLFDAVYDGVFFWSSHTIPHLISEMMFVLIIMELFRQVHRQINKQEFSLNPFLYIGCIASIRGLLLSGMGISMGEIEWEHGIVQLAVYSAIVLVLVACFFIYNKAIKLYVKVGSL